MAAVTQLIFFNQFIEDSLNGVHNLTADTIKSAFVPAASPPDEAVDVDFTDITEISTAGGYPAGGLTMPTSGWAQTAGVGELSSANYTFTATGDVDLFRYIVVYNATNGKLIGYYDRGSEAELHNSDPFRIFFSLSPTVIRMRQVVH